MSQAKARFFISHLVLIAHAERNRLWLSGGFRGRKRANSCTLRRLYRYDPKSFRGDCLLQRAFAWLQTLLTNPLSLEQASAEKRNTC